MSSLSAASRYAGLHAHLFGFWRSAILGDVFDRRAIAAARQLRSKRIRMTAANHRLPPTSSARVLLTIALATIGSPGAAQNVPASDKAKLDAAVASAAVEQAEVSPPATLTFANRPIVQLRSWPRDD